MNHWYLLAAIAVVFIANYWLEVGRVSHLRASLARTEAELTRYRDVAIVAGTTRGTTVAYMPGSTIAFAAALQRAIAEHKPPNIGHEVGVQWLPDVPPGMVRIVIQQHLPTPYERMVGRTKRAPNLGAS